MADLPRRELETDGAPVLRRSPARVPAMPFSSDEKQHSTLDERIDSGVGYSLESSEFSALSLEKVQEHSSTTDSGKLHRQNFIIEARQSHPTPAPTSSDSLSHCLQNFRDLSLRDRGRDSQEIKDSVKSNRCDSGICDSGIFSVEEGYRLEAGFSECHLSSVPYESSFSAQELEELFTQDEDGDTHLHMCIIHLLPEVSLKIISLAPDSQALSLPNHLHQTPLHLAVATRQLLVVRRLMVAGAALDAPDHQGNTPLHMACRDGLFDMAAVLLTPVTHQETLANQYPLPLLRIPQDLAARNYDGYTCCHLALQNGHLDMVQLLLSKGADVNQADGKSGRTLLHMAADLGYLDALRLLLPQPALNKDARTYGGLTAVSLAHGRRLNHVVEYLFRSGADCSQLGQEQSDSTDEEMNDYYDDICINGQPVHLN